MKKFILSLFLCLVSTTALAYTPRTYQQFHERWSNNGFYQNLNEYNADPANRTKLYCIDHKKYMKTGKNGRLLPVRCDGWHQTECD